MEAADFSGYATKAGLRCSDGRTIMPDAFKHQDTEQVPLVWQHGHNDPENVLGHVILEHRDDGVYGYGFFNKSQKAAHARELLEHKDINMMSIWANQLVERSKRVLHGAIREVSLVLAGANPGALIENVNIRHADGDTELIEDEAIIYTGLELEHAAYPGTIDDGKGTGTGTGKDDKKIDEKDETLQHAAGDKTVQDVYDSMTEEQKQVVHYMVGEALASVGDSAAHSDFDFDDDTEFSAVYDSLTDEQRGLMHHLIGEALESAENKNTTGTEGNDSKGKEMGHNVFEKGEDGKTAQKLSHSDVEAIVADAKKNGSFKAAVEEYALAHGIEDIDILFPDAKAISDTPELLARRVEWVSDFMGKVTKRPFSRIKTFSADITVPEARAKGYIKGNLKKEEFFKVARRVTTPTTVYKKQKLDRDDIVDITDFDVVAWLKGEMRIMLDEEIARAALLGDGRPADDEDKIDEESIRPIATDHELYTTTVYVNIDDASSNMSEVSDAIVLNRKDLRGSGLPTMYTTETFIAKFMTQRDTLGRRIYQSLDQVATELRVAAVVPVEVMEEYADLVAVLVNPVDYAVGATAGGQVSMFDDFDIDYNQYKYLIETRCSGALTKMKSAIVVRRTAGNAVLTVPAAPTFDPETGELTIVNEAGVVYRNAETDAVMNAAGSPYTVPAGESLTVVATPASSGYYFASSDDDEWTFTTEA